MADAGGPTLIASVRRALHLLDAVGGSDRPATAKSLTRALDMPLPTVYHLLRTLVYEGYLRKLDDGYVLGSCVESLRQGNQLLGALSLARPALQSLRDELRVAVYLSLYQDGEISLVDIAEGPHAPRVDLWVGTHDASHATAFGKCILSWLGKRGRDDYFSRHKLVGLTPHTVTDVRVLEQTLRVRRQVVADREEYLLGAVCAAAPVSAPGVLGSIAVSAPSRRLPALLAAGERLGQTAERVARAFAACG